MTTTPVPITGPTPVPVTDGGNAPAGFVLVNRGDNGGTVWLQSGPAGGAGALPLGPSASLQWTDRTVVPHAYLAAGAPPETLLVTDQSSGYNNPAAVAAATAVQLLRSGIPITNTAALAAATAGQIAVSGVPITNGDALATATAGQLHSTGIPGVFVDTALGSYRISSTLSSPLINVAACSSLIVSVSWPQPTPTGPNALRLQFSDPDVPDLDPISLYLTNDNATEQTPAAWTVPVLAPRLLLTNLASASSADAYVRVVGNNRTVPGLRQLGGELGITQLASPAPTPQTIGVAYLLKARNESGMQPTLSNLTRCNGAVMLACEGTGVGTLLPKWVDQSGKTAHASIPTNGTAQLIPFAHPTVPVSWSWIPSQTSTANAFYLSIVQS